MSLHCLLLLLQLFLQTTAIGRRTALKHRRKWQDDLVKLSTTEGPSEMFFFVLYKTMIMNNKGQ